MGICNQRDMHYLKIKLLQNHLNFIHSSIQLDMSHILQKNFMISMFQQDKLIFQKSL
jgi:hypothetical protein